MKPEYAKAAKILAKNDPPVYFAKIDGDENRELLRRFGIEGFPSLFFFKNGEQIDYTGGRTEDAIIKWVKKRIGPPSEVVSCYDLTLKVAENEFVLSFFG